ncbi:MAG: TIGR01212 family radical SAM protein [Anaerovoracaceae bacterium]
MRGKSNGNDAEPRINTVSDYLKQTFGRKMIKLSIDGGFTCPNRDGTKGTGGCLFCSSGGGGGFASDIDGQIKLLSKKWPDAGYLAYFQEHTNTYAPVDELREKYSRALADPRIEGLVIGTRPDCLPPDVLDLLGVIKSSHFMWVELGFQTSKPETVRLINRCYDNSVFRKAVSDLSSLGIDTVGHMILGLPGESRDDMMRTMDYMIESGIRGIKFHLLNVVKGARLAEEFPGYQPFASMDEYIDLVCDMLERLPRDIVVHRLTADAPRSELIAPEWSYKKRTILNGIYHELRERGTYQGAKLG